MLPALRTVVLLEDEHDDDDNLVTHRVEESQARAMEYRSDYYTACKLMKSDMPYRLEYMDRAGNSYLEDPTMTGDWAKAEYRWITSQQSVHGDDHFGNKEI
ncbi:hypothetical protein ZTR_09837 [Talaromyces verruculosus]|nr:hypothetical protein ZTR_09837 [Talaromyces verruculosus]